MKTAVFTTEECIRAAAEALVSRIESKRNAALALDAGDDALRVLRCAAALARERAVPLKDLRVFAVCEFAEMRGGPCVRGVNRFEEDHDAFKSD